MDGPAHYAEAERHLSSSSHPNGGPSDRKINLAMVHAVLALAAATVGPVTDEVGYANPEAQDWLRVLR